MATESLILRRMASGAAYFRQYTDQLKAWESPSDSRQEKEIFPLLEYSDRLGISPNLPFHG